MLLQSLHQRDVHNTNLPSFHIISYSKLVTPTNVNRSPSKTTAADDVGIGVGVSVGVVILVASVLVGMVIASRKSKYTNMFHHLFNVPPLVAFLHNTRIIQVRIFFVTVLLKSHS